MPPDGLSCDQLVRVSLGVVLDCFGVCLGLFKVYFGGFSGFLPVF